MNKFFRGFMTTLAALLIFTVAASSEEVVPTVEGLEQQGRRPLESAALEKLIVGRTLTVRNLSGGQLYEVVFFTDGFRLLHRRKDRGGQQDGGRGIATYEIVAGRLVTRLDGSIFDVRLYDAGGRYLAAGEGGAVEWEVVSSGEQPTPSALTVSALNLAGIEPLDDDALRTLVVGRTLHLVQRDTGTRYRATFRPDGLREIERTKTGAQEEPLPYEIADGRITTVLEGRQYIVRVYEVDGRHLAAHSGDRGAVNWEIISAR